MTALAERGYQWPANFTAIDLLHEAFGLEICGIPREEEAVEIQFLLHKLLPMWKHSHLSCKSGDRDPGWKVTIHRDEEAESDSYLEA
jgi:hypothetical protein